MTAVAPPAPTTMTRSAVISDDGTYRYALGRTWEADAPRLAWLMLNPSTADSEVDDATIRRCIAFSQRWGYGSLVVVNLFALRATNPRELARHPSPIGPGNDEMIEHYTDGLCVIAAWGAGHPPSRGYQLRVTRDWLLSERMTYHLGLTKAGHPRHPLYLAGHTTPTRWLP